MVGGSTPVLELPISHRVSHADAGKTTLELLPCSMTTKMFCLPCIVMQINRAATCESQTGWYKYRDMFSTMTMLQAGQTLRSIREELGLTMRDIETASARLAAKHKNEEFLVGPSRLSDIETKGLVPSIYRIYSLAVIYHLDFRDILSWYGVDLNAGAADMIFSPLTKSHRSDTLKSASAVQMPVRLDPSFDLRRTSNLGRMVEKWGIVPLTHLSKLALESYTYGYIGMEDFTMYPHSAAGQLYSGR